MDGMDRTSSTYGSIRMCKETSRNTSDLREIGVQCQKNNVLRTENLQTLNGA